MIIWLDAHFSPAVAFRMSLEFSVSAIAVRDLGWRDAMDQEIFAATRQANAVVMTKDIDFVRLVEKSGTPPQIILPACGNTSNTQLRQILKGSFGRTIEWLQIGEPVVEITAH